MGELILEFKVLRHVFSCQRIKTAYAACLMTSGASTNEQPSISHVPKAMKAIFSFFFLLACISQVRIIGSSANGTGRWSVRWKQSREQRSRRCRDRGCSSVGVGVEANTEDHQGSAQMVAG